MNYRALLLRHYPVDTPLRRLLLHHSGQVCRRALDIARRHPELHADLRLVEAGAMLHDIGIYLTHAPGIHCHGSAPYLMHGSLGARILRAEGHEALARICERHTGTGLRAADIRALQLPLPAVEKQDKPQSLPPLFCEKKRGKQIAQGVNSPAHST